MRKVLVLLLFIIVSVVGVNAQNRWQIADYGVITWVVDGNLPHYDHIEISGEQMSAVIRYGVNNDGSLQYERSMIWPMLRTLPNDTHASLMRRSSIDYPSFLMVNGMALRNEKVRKISIDGKLIITSDYIVSKSNIGAAKSTSVSPSVEITRTIFPSKELPALCERYQITNISDKPMTVNIPTHLNVYHTDRNAGVDGSYTIESRIIEGDGFFILQPSESTHFDVAIQAYKDSAAIINYDTEEAKRVSFITEIGSNLILDSPDQTINNAFAFAKVRASESIYKTKGGYMHGPGGESYYAAIWANDQAEYVNPFFPYLGYEIGDESAMNSYRHFARFINDSYEPIPSSIIAEGTDIWNGAGDRGDAAMIAYGASRNALALGDKEKAQELFPLITWCLEYCRRKTTSEGVVASDTDELEGRFPSGEANLCTSSLYYDALISTSYLSKALFGHYNNQYLTTAKQLRKAIESYFGDDMDGFETYRYYDGNTKLRSWICIPLTVNIFDRASGTTDALFSPILWTDNGLLTEAGDSTFWDRSTLYALRGVFAAGKRDEALKHLKHYSTQRLLGEHVPYPIEAYPEGSQRHLSAESGLYCRIFTEGIFGIRPTSLSSFDLTPQLPAEWDYMTLRNINAFSSTPFDISIQRKENKINVTVTRNGVKICDKVIDNGGTMKVVIPRIVFPDLG